uniref:Thioredoxin n=1 Tax=Neobodo designis TaxID=312471 RepID=A0A7S1QTS1_NEODS|mmetsp:Transcript_52147/g.160629  ORF Transcript_52147/g.160629 Transcript_52147/m.160629 type:complete len:108 (+) Transcript_52147:50-373(+)
MAEKVDAAGFKAALNNNAHVVLDCYADWCGPCIQFAPKFDAMSEKQPDVHFVKMNVEEHEDVAAEYGLRSVPTFLVFDKDGNKTAVIEGAAEHKIQAAIDGVLAKKE